MLLQLALAALGSADGHPLPPSGTFVVRGDTRIQAGEYLRPAPGEGGRDGVVRLEGLRDVEVDLSGVVLRGARPGTDLDALVGYGLVVRDCENVVLRGGTLAGFKACLVVERTRGLTLRGLRFEGWYGQRLRSSARAEHPGDWLFPHENDAGQWLAQHGAAISLTDSPGARIEGCTGRQGQNGILLTRSDGARIVDNDFSFLSGWGLGMYRSSAARVHHNLFDYCVRGYGHGVYWRGQDSAAILMFERCSDNVFAFNSGTHSGDGVFLFAGQDTVAGRAFERGELDAGGSDRNLWYQNDFSYAVANGIEATFSRGNRAIGNRLNGCHQHGVWGGYSRELVIADNELRGTLGPAISIEHGQENRIVANRIADNELGLELWWDEDPELVGGPFGQRRDTSSRDTWVLANEFARNGCDLALRRSERLFFHGNRFVASPSILQAAGVVQLATPQQTREQGRVLDAQPEALVALLASGGEGRPAAKLAQVSLFAAVPSPAGSEVVDPALLPEPRQGRYDFDAPPAHALRGLDAIVIGPFGPWDFVSGAPRPVEVPLGGELAAARWNASWFSWAQGPDPRQDLEGWRALQRTPLASSSGAVLSDPWGAEAATKQSVGAARFGLIARTRVEVAAGSYRLSVLSDDGVRVSIDGRVVLENWTHHAPTQDEARVELAAGAHELVVEYFQIDGASALLVELLR